MPACRHSAQVVVHRAEVPCDWDEARQERTCTCRPALMCAVCGHAVLLEHCMVTAASDVVDAIGASAKA